MNLGLGSYGRLLLCLAACVVVVGVPAGVSRAATPTATVVVSNPNFSTLAVDRSDVAWGRQRGVNNQLWKSTDKGQTWTHVTGWDSLGRRIWYITPLASSALLVAYDTGLNIAVARSTDGGATWSTVLNLLCLTQNCSERDTTLTPESIVEGNGFVFLGTYNTASAGVNPSRVYRSANDGQTWTLVNTLTDVRHIHGLAWDSFKNRLYVLTGDSDGDGIRYSSDNGTTLQPLCTQFTCNAIQGFVDPVGGQHFIFGTDNEHTTNRIQRLDTTTGAVTQLKSMPYVSFSSSYANGVWLVAESHEPGPIGDPEIHLYGSSDGGATWATLYSFTLPDGNGSYEMYVDSIYSNGDVAVHVNGQGTVVLRFGTAPVVPPVNTALPTITGTAQQGQTLTSSTGTWTNSPTGFAYQWRRCDTSGSNCQNIASATSSSYLLVAGDVGSTIRVQVTASNGAGSNAATSAATATVTAATSAPVNTALPTITGTAQQGQTLTASTGTWTNSPTGFAYQWRRCDTSGSNCQNIASATSSSYLLVAGDVGSTIRVQVTASNGAGSNAATSAATGVVQAQGPLTNLVLNPGFETNPSEWTAFGNGTSSWATDSVHSGSRSAKIVTGNQSLSRWTQNFNVSPGQSYDSSAWIRTTSGNGSLAATFWNGATYTGLTLETAAVNGDWKRVTLSFTVPSGANRIRLELRNAYSSGTMWFDDAALFAAGGAPSSPPVNTAPPTITGTAQQGQTLTSSTGTWTNSPTNFAYQWRRCDTSGSNCQNIASATSSSYLLVAGDVGSTIRVQVTASNGAGSNAATSAATATVTAATSAPVNTALPTITGTAQQGQTLTSSTGTWTNSPTNFAYQWRRCDTSGSNCQNIASATSSSYLLVAGDVGSTIRVQVTASNGAGSNAATSAATATVTAATSAPVNTALPTITGTAQQGQTLTSSTGTWTNSPTNFAYQWRRCDSSGSNCQNIASATSSSYLLVAGDVGSTIRVQVTASNGAGSNAATSAATATVTAATSAPVNTALPTITGTAQQGQTLAASTGTWTNSPTNFAYQWRRCDSSGNNCQNIASATSSSYLLVAGDVGSTIRVQVTASNGAGSNAATSAATATVTAATSAPVNTALPTITGTAQQGQTLAASTGTWTNSPTSFAYQWRRCDSSGNNCQNIASATSSSYLLVAGDVGSTIRVQVTASNGAGSNAATSAATGVVQAQGPLTNLCLNPGFETSPTEWAFAGTGTGTWATDSVHSGSSSVKIVTASDTLSRWMQNFTVTPGQSYQLSTWIRTTSGRGSLAATFWNGATYSGLTLETASVAGDWQKVTLAVTVPANVNRMRLELRNAYTVGTSWFDDVEVFLQ